MKVARVHNDIPWGKVKKMWDAGKSYEFMAKAINRFNQKSDDPTKPMRAIVSRGLTVGFTNADGKTEKLAPRVGMKALGMGKKAPKATNKVTKAKKAKVAHKTGNAVLIALDASGKFVRIETSKPKNLIPGAKVLPTLKEIVAKLEAQAATEAPQDPVLPEQIPTAPVQDETITVPEVQGATGDTQAA